jgi:hypothetical protein
MKEIPVFFFRLFSHEYHDSIFDFLKDMTLNIVILGMWRRVVW